MRQTTDKPVCIGPAPANVYSPEQPPPSVLQAEAEAYGRPFGPTRVAAAVLLCGLGLIVFAVLLAWGIS